MAKNRKDAAPPELPPELQSYDPSDGWASWSEWSRARGSAMHELGLRRLPAIQAMTQSAPLGGEPKHNEENNS